MSVLVATVCAWSQARTCDTGACCAHMCARVPVCARVPPCVQMWREIYMLRAMQKYMNYMGIYLKY